jgi:Tfp pilus assembly protein PilN
MKAVNLIPADQRRNSSLSGRSGGTVYILIGTLAGLVLLAGLYGLTSKSINDKTAQIADATARANAAEATANSLAGYTDFSAARTQRTAAVKALADARVDWAHILSELARTLPANSRLTTFRGSTAGTAATATGAASPATTAAAPASAPAIDLGGCTTSHTAVSTLMADLRRIDGVSDVTLSSSAKQAGAGAAGSTGSSSGSASASSAGGCGTSSTTFAMKLTFKAPVAGATTAGQSATTAGSTK